jgi:hypothetical protein
VKKPIIATKKDLVEAVRQIKPSHSAPSLRPEKKTSSVADILPETSDSTVRELGTLEDGVHMYARRYNELKMEADRKHAELDKLLVSVRVLCSVQVVTNRRFGVAGQTERSALGKERDGHALFRQNCGVGPHQAVAGRGVEGAEGYGEQGMAPCRRSLPHAT